MVGRMTPADEPAGDEAATRWLPIVMFAASALIAAGVVFFMKSQQLDRQGVITLGQDPVHTLHLANRDDEARMFRIRTDAGVDVPALLPARSRMRCELDHPGSGDIQVSVQRVITQGPGCVDRVIEWTTVAGEELTVMIQEDGEEIRLTEPWMHPTGGAFVRVHSLAASPVLVHYEDLADLGGGGNVDDDGRPAPSWIGAGAHRFIEGTGLEPGRAARLQYCITALAAPAVATISPTSDSSHEVVIEEDGSLRVGGPSLRTLAGL